jgi:thymidylate kinase
MQSAMKSAADASDPAPQTETPGGEGDNARSALMARVFQALDEAEIAFCIPHGHADLPGFSGSDIDIIVDPSLPPGELSRILADRRATLGYQILESRGHLQVVATPDGAASIAFDFAPDVTLGSRHFISGREVLAKRIRHGNFWIPEPHMEFICLLLRFLSRGAMNVGRRRRLSALYDLDRAGCDRQIARFFPATDAKIIVSAASRDRWEELDPEAGRLSRAMQRRALLRHPLRAIRLRLEALGQKLDRIARPNGLRVVLLGPDGAGKSSMVQALENHPLALFNRTECRGFAPRMFRRLLRRRHGPTDQPHALAPRSAPASIIRAGYWLLHQLAEHATSRVDLARSTLILYDRHLVDVLVDQKRYRYGGPRWLLSAIWSIMPRPDLILLLDAPADVLHRRKQELSLAETDRQRQQYLRLVTGLENGHVIDAAQPFENVVAQVSTLLVAHLARREAARRNLPAGGHHD